MNSLRVGYFADGPWSHRALSKLNSDNLIEVVFICARSEKPDEILKSISSELKIDFFTHPRVNSTEFFNLVSKYDCDLFVSMSFDQIFHRRLIDLPRLGIINCHAGKLPFYRGRNVLNWALINDEREFGITVHFIDEGIDTGDIILQRLYEINDSDDYSTLLMRSYQECSSILYDAIKILQSGSTKGIKQSDLDLYGSYCTARVPGDEILEWNKNSRDIFNFVRSISRPGPEARTQFGNTEIKINKTIFLPNATKYVGIPGSVIGVEEKSFLVKTLDSYLRITDWTGYPKPRIGDRFH
jgi:methionyl-tRNA formyltransferase